MEEAGGELWKELQECKIWRLMRRVSRRKLRQWELDAFPWLGRIISAGVWNILTSMPSHLCCPGHTHHQPACCFCTWLLSPPRHDHLPSQCPTSNQHFLTCAAWPQGLGCEAAGVQSSRQISGPGPSSRWRQAVPSGPGAPAPASVLCTAVFRRQGTFEKDDKEF